MSKDVNCRQPWRRRAALSKMIQSLVLFLLLLLGHQPESTLAFTAGPTVTRRIAVTNSKRTRLHSVASPTIRSRRRNGPIDDLWRIREHTSGTPSTVIKNCSTNRPSWLSRLSKGFGRSTFSKKAALAAVLIMLPGSAKTAQAATTMVALSVAAPMPRATSSSTAIGDLPWHLALAGLVLASQSLGTLLTISMQHVSVFYMLQLAAHPMLTKSLTAGVIGITGDYFAQWLEHRLRDKVKSSAFQSNYDARRGMSIFTDGVLISGPLMHVGYELFEKVLPVAAGAGSSTSSLAAISHVLADSILLDSVFVATTFVVTGLMEGYQARQIGAQMKSDYLPTLRASFLTSVLVMPLEFVCFRFLPLSFRVLAVNFIDVIWDGVISFMAHRSRHHNQHAAGATASSKSSSVPVTADRSDNSSKTFVTPVYNEPTIVIRYSSTATSDSSVGETALSPALVY